jgi:hypothetical protein
MQFSKPSQDYVSLVFDKYSNCMTETNQDIHKRTHMLFDKLFLEIKDADKYVKRMKASNCFTRTIQHIETSTQMQLPTVYNSTFFPSIVKEHILLNTIKCIKYSCSVNDRKINILFHLYKIDEDISKYDRYATMAYMLIYVISLYSSSVCAKELNIFIYLTNFRKLLPETNYEILSSENVNTGFTTSCSYSGEIVIYRKEEWFKVLIHETFHIFGLDFSNFDQRTINHKIKTLYPINSNFRVYEAYCEIWGRMLNAMFISYFMLDNKNNQEAFYLYWECLIQLERIYALYKCQTVLEYMGLTYEDLYSDNEVSKTARDNLYKEHTNVFSYYILTTVLLNNYIGFLEWCNDNNLELIKFNRTQRNIDSFFDFIKINYNSKNLLDAFKCINDYNEKYKSKSIQLTELLKKSLRMSLLEFY